MQSHAPSSTPCSPDQVCTCFSRLAHSSACLISVSLGQKNSPSHYIHSKWTSLLFLHLTGLLEASSPIELWEAPGVLCLIELLRGAGAPHVFFLIELFPGPVEAGSARQSPLIFLNDVASVSVNHHAAAARRRLLWLTSQRDKQSSLLDTDEEKHYQRTSVLLAKIAKHFNT